MSEPVEYRLNQACVAEITEHLGCCDAYFVPPLSGRVDLNNYAAKIASQATRFEAWSDDRLVGLAAVYCNDQEQRIAYITSVSVLCAWTGCGIAVHLMRQCIEYAKALGMRQINLEVAGDNVPAIRLYEKSGFFAGRVNGAFVGMTLALNAGNEHEQST